jgi:hypothetical protein
LPYTRHASRLDGLIDWMGSQEVQDDCAGHGTKDDRQDGPCAGDDPADDGATPPWRWPLLSLPS